MQLRKTDWDDLIHGTSPKLAIISTKMSMPLRKTDSWMNSLWSWRSTGWRWRGEKPIAGTPTYEYKVQPRIQKEIHIQIQKQLRADTKSLFGVDLSDVARVCGGRENLWSYLKEDEIQDNRL